MATLKVHIRPHSADHSEVLTAMFTLLPIAGIEESGNDFFVYVDETDFHSEEWQSSIAGFEAEFPFSSNVETLPDINWNKEWESHFDPVYVDDFLTIRADFHQIKVTTQQEIIIVPKMSFGTGHHATTWMMARVMSLLDFKDCNVLDAGTGTGILAILALKLGAEKVAAYDNDPWCYENAAENFALNDIDSNFALHIGSLNDVPPDSYDIILANINRNYLLDEAGSLVDRLVGGGLLVVSGILEADIRLVLDRYLECGAVAQYLLVREGWACIIFKNPL